MPFRFRPSMKVLHWIKKHKALVIAAAIVLALLLIVFGTQIFLFITFMMGNDTVVRLKVDKEALSLVHGEEKEVEFEAGITTNLFCKATCTSEFIDVGRKKIIERQVFTLRTGNDHDMEYMLSASRTGEGMDLYRMDLVCRSKRSFLCHTSEEPTTRSILVAVEYGLNEREQMLKNEAQEKSIAFAQDIAALRADFEELRRALSVLNKTVAVDEPIADMARLQRQIVENEKHPERMLNLWEGQDYAQIGKQSEDMAFDLAEAKQFFQRTNESVAAYISSFNLIVERLGQMNRELLELQPMELSNFSRIREINESISALARLDADLHQKSRLGKKESEVNALVLNILQLSDKTRDEASREVLQRETESDIVLDILCAESGVCIEHPTIEERAYQENFELNTTCTRVERVRDRLLVVNNSLRAAFVAQNYPMVDEFWNNVTMKVRNAKNSVMLDYSRQLPANGTNTVVLQELLAREPFAQTEEYDQYNLTPALVHELVQQKTPSCVLYNGSRDLVTPISLQPIGVEEVMPVPVTFEMKEPAPQCCALGECRACCDTEQCMNDPDTFPVLFLHGHAFNKDISAEYSLEGFNKIQNKLEEDGFLSAGAITLYTERDTPYGIWGRVHTPLTLRGSYYFDIFKEPENYIVVQMKSENIDTYALRLKEIVDTIKYKTGKPKVKIVAFSMGGLVARRYVQIFGSDAVQTIVLIGTPNKGVVGDVADYCSVIGGELECRDLNANSLFINKLNQGKLSTIPVHNIVGTGCVMDDGLGDGTVAEERGRLEGAQNYVIEGTCASSVYPLHLAILDIDAYPKVYEIVKKALS
jgi:hypothetical protein